MRTVRLLSAAIMAAAGLVAVGATTQAANAASSKDLSVTHVKVMSHEVFTAYGRVSTHDSRSVWLQYRNQNHGAWLTTASQVSGSMGYFEFPASTTRSRYYRFYAPKHASSPAIVGNSRKVTLVAQSVTYFGLTPAFQCTNIGHGNVTMFARFYPARQGREVTFATNIGPLTTFEDENGIASVNFAPGTSPFASGPYHAVAKADSYATASSKKSSPFNYNQQICLI